MFRPITTLHEWPKHEGDYCVINIQTFIHPNGLVCLFFFHKSKIFYNTHSETLSFQDTCHSQMVLQASETCKLVRTTTRVIRCPQRRCIFLVENIQQNDEHNSLSLREREELVTHVSCQCRWPTDCMYTRHGRRHNCSCVKTAAQKLKGNRGYLGLPQRWPTDCMYTRHGRRHNCSCVKTAAEKLKGNRGYLGLSQRWPTDCMYIRHGRRRNCSCVKTAAEKLKENRGYLGLSQPRIR